MSVVTSSLDETGTSNVKGARLARPELSTVALVSAPVGPQKQENPLRDVSRLGQSVWLDGLSRNLIRSGRLQRLIDNDGVSGVMSNLTLLEKAISGSPDYDEDIRRLARQGKSVEQTCESIVVSDAQEAADILRPVYDRTQKRDGYVSLEVSPHLAHDTRATVVAARGLWGAVDRSNLLIAVPATLSGVSAARQLITEGINVNVTLLFDLLRYRGVLEAWISGLSARAQQGASVGEVACVAGFFLSPLDALVDPMLEHAVAQGQPNRDRAWQLRGRAAVANAKVAEVVLQRFLAGFRFAKLMESGAQPLRLLWASTGRLNPDYSDIKYVESLIGRDTASALSLETLEAYRGHGHPALRLEEGLDEARRVLYELPQCGVEMHEIAEHLEDEGLANRASAHDALLNCIRTRCREALRGSGR